MSATLVTRDLPALAPIRSDQCARPCSMPRSAGSLSSAQMKCRPPWNRWPGLAVMPSMATPRQMTLALKVFGLNCSLKSSKSRERSSTDALMQQLFGELAKQGATGKIVRAADYNICLLYTSDAADEEDSVDLGGRRIIKKKKKKKE